jgi:hypothetical protein
MRPSVSLAIGVPYGEKVVHEHSVTDTLKGRVPVIGKKEKAGNRCISGGAMGQVPG